MTNALGGYASGSLEALPTRRYHGLFIPNLPTYGRTVIIPLIEETAVGPDGPIALNGREADFSLCGNIVRWTFRIRASMVEKRLMMPYGYNTVHIQYRLLQGDAIKLYVRPYFTFRPHDTPFGHPKDWPFALNILREGHELHAFPEAPAIRLRMNPLAVFVADRKNIPELHYSKEQERGLDFVSDCESPGYYTAHLDEAGQSVTWTASSESWGTIGAAEEWKPDDAFNQEWTRLERRLRAAPAALKKEWPIQLVLAADQFVILPHVRSRTPVSRAGGEFARTVIAGYHWFTDWGRDTMISLEGLTLCTGQFREARAILETFSHYVKDGLIPNHFPEGTSEAIYNTADASLWFFHAIHRYLEWTKDDSLLASLYPVLECIMDHHIRGTRFGIGVDERDGLLTQGEPGYALTWMDAKVDEWVVTPRRGKAVEIQGLWYNALKLMSGWANRLQKSNERYESYADRAHRSFNRAFWDSDRRYLYDVVDGPEGNEPLFRPNQLFALSLLHPILQPDRWSDVVQGVREKLVTPYGLRTLEASDPAYRPHYQGDRRARDAAYHQGLVWAWLIGPYVDASLKVDPDTLRARDLLKGFKDHLEEAGVGSISEIFDAEAPFTARGCIAQAWSVAEVLRVYTKLTT